ncbi:MAG: hypothetical protein ACR2QC_06350 [Gammaproteobacteria bacterium]
MKPASPAPFVRTPHPARGNYTRAIAAPDAPRFFYKDGGGGFGKRVAAADSVLQKRAFLEIR